MGTGGVAVAYLLPNRSSLVVEGKDYHWQLVTKSNNKKKGFCGKFKKKEDKNIDTPFPCSTDWTKKIIKEKWDEKAGIWIRVKDSNFSKDKKEKKVESFWYYSFASDQNDCKIKRDKDGWIELKCKENKNFPLIK